MPAEKTLATYLAEFCSLMDLARTGEDTFIASSFDRGVGRLFGGQVIAQALCAADATVDNKPPHSLHGYFLRAGSELLPVEFTVTRNFDGRRIANRHVVASQEGRVLFTMTASFHAGDVATSHALPMPDVLPPEALRTREDVLKQMFEEKRISFRTSMNAQPFEMRVPDSFAPDGPTPDDTVFYHWFRAPAPLGDDPRLHRALIAYVTDYALLGTSTKMHGLVIFRGDISGISLDHAMWFHEPEARADEWLLYVTDSPWSGRGRGYARGTIYSRDGKLVATVAQEGMIRLS